MTATDLVAWFQRHDHTYESASAALGVSRAMFAYYLAGDRPIPQTVALLCAAIDRLAKRRR